MTRVVSKHSRSMARANAAGDYGISEKVKHARKAMVNMCGGGTGRQHNIRYRGII